MERIFKIIIFLILLICLVMTIRLFAIGGVVADEYGLSGATIYGGKTGLYMAWARMFLLLAGSFLAFLHIFED